ncbi:MAG: tetratricopeptide repeat protein [Pseudomonadales bacterium]|nr:tetratricopeptide repeat protein [Pseudomonadales bacterium]
MKFTKPLLCALLVSSLAAPVYAAPNNWGESDKMSGIEEKIEAKDYRSAIADLKNLIADGSKDADAYNLLGFTHRKLKYYDIAEEYYHMALILEPEHKGALEYLGELYVETDRMDKAREMLVKLDNACFISCEEYRTLKDMIEKKEKGLEVSSKW